MWRSIVSCADPRGVLPALLCVLLALCGAAAPCAEDPAAQFARGETAFNRGDLGEAIRLFREAAEQGHAPAQSRLAYVLDKAEENEEALAWYRKAAEQGDAQGQFGLGQMIAVGEGTGKDPATGLAWILRAAGQGLLPALVAGARLLEAGEPRTLRDPKAAFDLWRRAAAQGDHVAMNRIVAVYRNGELGQPVNEVEAKSWEAKLPVDPRAKKRRN